MRREKTASINRNHATIRARDAMQSGVFSGNRWTTQIYLLVRNVVLASG
jgi:hypothetical protein